MLPSARRGHGASGAHLRWPELRSLVKARTLLMTGVAVASTALTGGLATDPNSAYYRGLKQPSWQPAPPVYGLVWTPLYADLAVTTAQAADALEQQGRSGQRAALIRALS